jgi:hypothetical protein
VPQVLEECLGYTDWPFGTAFYYRDLRFINQVDGGDEWLTIKAFWDDGGPIQPRLREHHVRPIHLCEQVQGTDRTALEGQHGRLPGG